MIDYKYNKQKKKFTENGHTMFEEDVLQRLKRLSYLEEQIKQCQLLSVQRVIHRCKLANYGDEEKKCMKCGYTTWNNDKTDNEIIEDMINAGYDVPDCDSGA